MEADPAGSHEPVWTPESTQRPSYFTMYRRGPWLLSRLEERIGTERFDRFLQRYMTEPVRTTPELLERLEAVAGAEAAQWFRDELARGPAPAR
jgi:aminopeptidase N